MTWPLLLTPFLPLLGFVPGGLWALPLVAPLTVYLPFRQRVREGNYRRAWTLGIAWAFLLSLGVVALVFCRPFVARDGILNGEQYGGEMLGWIATGSGRESDPAAFIPQHLFHLAVFLLLTWASAGYLGLVLGAALVGYMSYFVGCYAAASGHPLLGILAAWLPWSVIRVFAFVLLGALFSRPLLVRRRWPFAGQEYRLMALAGAGLLADVVIKALCAPAYGVFLRHFASSAGLGN